MNRSWAANSNFYLLIKEILPKIASFSKKITSKQRTQIEQCSKKEFQSARPFILEIKNTLL